MSKYSKEFKLAVIQHYLSGNGGFKTVADQYGVKYAYVRKWVHAFKAHGQKSFVKGHAKYSGTFKLSVLQHMEHTNSRSIKRHPTLISQHPAQSVAGNASTMKVVLQP
jgi:transposase-like protein